MSSKPHRRPGAAPTRGASLVEVLIAVLVLSIGILGIAGLQARALQNNDSAFQRSQAVMLSYFILDAMRANVAVARSGGYDMKKTCSAVTGGSLAAEDQKTWMNALKDNLGQADTTCGEISCDPATSVCTVRVYWDDGRGVGGSSKQMIETRSRL